METLAAELVGDDTVSGAVVIATLSESLTVAGSVDGLAPGAYRLMTGAADTCEAPADAETLVAFDADRQGQARFSRSSMSALTLAALDGQIVAIVSASQRASVACGPLAPVVR